jgi:hypothetical protein
LRARPRNGKRRGEGKGKDELVGKNKNVNVCIIKKYERASKKKHVLGGGGSPTRLFSFLGIIFFFSFSTWRHLHFLFQPGQDMAIV